MAEDPSVDPTPADPDVVDDTPPADEPFDRDRAMNTILKQREEAKQLRAKIREAEAVKARLAELEEAHLSEQEKQAKRLAELETEREAWQEEKRGLALALAFQTLPPELQVADVDLALAAINRSNLEYGADGKPTNLADEIADLLERKPILRATPAAPTAPPAPKLDAGAGRQNGPPASLRADELEAARETGLDADRFGAMKGVTNVEDYLKMQAARQAATA